MNNVPSPAAGGLLDDLLEIFTAPSKVFERRRDGGYGKLLLVLVALAVMIYLATMGLTSPFWDAQFDLTMRQAAEKGNPVPAEGMEMARTMMKWSGVIGSALILPIVVWLGALFVMLGAKVAGGSVNYRQGALIVTLASFPRLLGPIIMAVLGLVLAPETIRSISDGALGPARFFDPMTTSPVLLGIMANFELTSLWSIVLIALGISVIARVSRGSGWVGAAVVFACTLALTIIPAALM